MYCICCSILLSSVREDTAKCTGVTVGAATSENDFTTATKPEDTRDPCTRRQGGTQ